MTTAVEEGGPCPKGCGGTLALPKVKDCSCHISPPCSACTDNPLTCGECGWECPPPEHEAPSPEVAAFYQKMMDDYREARARGHTFPHGGRVFNADHDGRSGSTHVIRGEYEGPVMAEDIIAHFGTGTFGHRGPTIVSAYVRRPDDLARDKGRFTYTKITD